MTHDRTQKEWQSVSSRSTLHSTFLRHLQGVESLNAIKFITGVNFVNALIVL